MVDPVPADYIAKMDEVDAEADKLAAQALEAAKALVTEKFGDHPIWFEAFTGMFIAELVQQHVKAHPLDTPVFVELLLGSIAETLREITPNG